MHIPVLHAEKDQKVVLVHMLTSKYYEASLGTAQGHNIMLWCVEASLSIRVVSLKFLTQNPCNWFFSFLKIKTRSLNAWSLSVTYSETLCCVAKKLLNIVRSVYSIIIRKRGLLIKKHTYGPKLYEIMQKKVIIANFLIHRTGNALWAFEYTLSITLVYTNWAGWSLSSSFANKIRAESM